jgi:hypothetical protein
METDFSGEYINAENTKDGDILTILDEGIYEEKQDPVSKKVRRVLNITVENNGKRKTYSPDQETGRKFQAAFGTNTRDWLGKKFKAKLVSYVSFGKTKMAVRGDPITAEKVK